MCVFQERLLLINSPKSFVSIAVRVLFIFIRNLYVRITRTFISELNLKSFVKIQGKQLALNHSFSCPKTTLRSV